MTEDVDTVSRMTVKTKTIFIYWCNESRMAAVEGNVPLQRIQTKKSSLPHHRMFRIIKRVTPNVPVVIV